MKKTVTNLFIAAAANILITTNALAQPGTLDVSFDTDGIVTLPVNQSSNGYATVIQPDGKIIVVGYSIDSGANGPDMDQVVARFLPNGSPDASFGSGGSVITELNTGSTAFSVALEAGTGKIVIAGLAEVNSSNQISLFRYNSNGTPDNNFGTNGSVIGAVGNVSQAHSVIIQPDGKIVVGVQTPSDSLIVTRFNNNGTVDNSFNGTGKGAVAFSSSTYGTSMVLQPDGKIVVAGSMRDPNNNNKADFILGRLNADGTVDTGFGTNGAVQTVLITNELLGAIALQPDGRILATGTRGDNGTSPQEIMLIRYTANGTLDMSFGTMGMIFDKFVATDLSRVESILIQPDGKIIVGGQSYVGVNTPPISSSCALARFSSVGAVDTGFGNNGKVVTNVTPSIGVESFRSLKLQQDGKLVAAGVSSEEFVVARYITSISSAGLDEASNTIDGVTVFPNPATDQLTVSYTLAQETEVSVHICDVSGRYIAPLVTPSSVTAGKHEQMIQLPVRLESGCYYVVVTAGNQQQTERIIVSR